MLFALGLLVVHFEPERIFLRGIGAVVGSMDELVLFSLLPLSGFFPLFILASQLFLALFKRCA